MTSDTMHKKQSQMRQIGSNKYSSSFTSKANERHAHFYDYELPVTNFNSKSKIDIICPIHDKFVQEANNHLMGKGCPKCAVIKRSDARKGGDPDDFIKKAKSVHGHIYDYNFVKYVNPKTKIDILCPKHGVFTQRPDSHLAGSGCRKCSNEKNSIVQKSNTAEFVEKAKKIHGDKFSYDNVDYKGCLNTIAIKCDIHGEFKQAPRDHLTGRGCRKCSLMGSKQEDFIENFLIQNGIEYIKNDRTVISPKELDFIIPSKKIAIECHGLYWHSTEKKIDKKCHLNKLNDCNSNGYRIVQIFEDEIMFNPNIVITRLKNLLGLIKKSIPARKCKVFEINKSLCSRFLKKYHIQSSDKSSTRLGLFYKNKLVSVMTFSKPRSSLGCSKKYSWELVRFCSISHFKVIGAAGKLFSFFVKNYLNFGDVLVSYADRRWSEGDVYKKIGFTFSHNTSVNYWYFKPNDLKRLHRFSFRKSIISKLGNFKNMTEPQIMKQLKYYKIYDCGNMCFIYTKPLHK